MVMKVLPAAFSPVIVVAAWAGASIAQAPMCPPEVASARAMLEARGGDLQASRSQDVQAPRSQDVQALRNQGSQDTQASRSQDVQAPRSQDVQAPRNQQDPQAQGPAASARTTQKAQALVREAEAACRLGNTAQASQKALAALEIIKQ